jgi:hypothetical protein
MNPCGNQHSADALRDHYHLFQSNLAVAGSKTDKFIDIPH